MPRISYHLHLPEHHTSCVVFASPHSGRDYPWSFVKTTVLDENRIRSSEDAFVDRLFDSAPQFGSPLLRAGAPRAYVDLNRAHDELDPALIEGVRKVGHNPRVASGLGVIPRVVAHGRSIYSGKLSRSEADSRIKRIWHPYHQKLSEILARAQAQFGQAILIDCHSMPREALDSTLKNAGQRPEIVIGDRFGASASLDHVDQVEAAFTNAGFRVARNSPFAGAFTTLHYGRPMRGQHAIQIEIDRSLYMDEKSIRPNRDFQAFRKVLRGVTAELVNIGLQDNQRLAAE